VRLVYHRRDIRARQPPGANDTGCSSAEFDAACQAEAQQIYAADLSMLSLFFQSRHTVARAGPQGYVLTPSAPSEPWNVEEIERTR
jgi:hypothetical protein